MFSLSRLDWNSHTHTHTLLPQSYPAASCSSREFCRNPHSQHRAQRAHGRAVFHPQPLCSLAGGWQRAKQRRRGPQAQGLRFAWHAAKRRQQSVSLLRQRNSERKTFAPWVCVGNDAAVLPQVGAGCTLLSWGHPIFARAASFWVPSVLLHQIGGAAAKGRHRLLHTCCLQSYRGKRDRAWAPSPAAVSAGGDFLQNLAQAGSLHSDSKHFALGSTEIRSAHSTIGCSKTCRETSIPAYSILHQQQPGENFWGRILHTTMSILNSCR